MKLLSTLGVTALTAAIAFTGLAPAQAAPVIMPTASAAASDVVNVDGGYYFAGDNGDRWQNRRYYNNRHGWNRNRDGWRHDDWRRHGGYHRDRNLGGALIGGLITGAIVGGVLNNSGPVHRERVYRGGNAHIQWCYDRYRSYRASDNTYVPRVGQRAYCNSPYN